MTGTDFFKEFKYNGIPTRSVVTPHLTPVIVSKVEFDVDHCNGRTVMTAGGWSRTALL